MRNLVIVAGLLAVTQPVNAQINKCVGADGGVSYSDRPCVGAQKSESVVIEEPSVSPEEARAIARERDKGREKLKKQRLAAESESIDRRIAESKADILEIKSENYDPTLCAAAKTKMAALKKREVYAYRIDPEYFTYQQKIELYCGS